MYVRTALLFDNRVKIVLAVTAGKTSVMLGKLWKGCEKFEEEDRRQARRSAVERETARNVRSGSKFVHSL